MPSKGPIYVDFMNSESVILGISCEVYHSSANPIILAAYTLRAEFHSQKSVNMSKQLKINMLKSDMMGNLKSYIHLFF